MEQKKETENLDKSQFETTEIRILKRSVQRLLNKIRALNRQNESLKLIIKGVDTAPSKNDLIQEINNITKEIESKNEDISKHEGIVSGYNKEQKLLKQTIKEISKKYSDAEDMYEQVSVTLEQCMKDNEGLKFDLSEKKKSIIVEYKLFGFVVFTKTLT